MKILIPKTPADPRQPQWWVLSFQYHYQSGIRRRVLDLLVRTPLFSFQIRINATVDNLAGVKYTRPSRFTDIYICHPNGGGARKLKCEECGAEYPFPTGVRAYPCGFCAVERESKVVLWWRRNMKAKVGEQMYQRVKQLWPKPLPIPGASK